jgi:hypothetical protein
VNRTTIKIGQESKPEIRQQLIGIFAHQCHETFDIISRPGPDDRVGAYAEIVRQVRPARIAIARAIAHRVRPDIPLSPADLAGVLVDVKDMSFVIAVCMTHRVLARSLGWLQKHGPCDLESRRVAGTGANTLLRRSVTQILVNQPNCCGAVSHGGGDPLRLAVADVSHCEDARDAGLKGQRGR